MRSCCDFLAARRFGSCVKFPMPHFKSLLFEGWDSLRTKIPGAFLAFSTATMLFRTRIFADRRTRSYPFLSDITSLRSCPAIPFHERIRMFPSQTVAVTSETLIFPENRLTVRGPYGVFFKRHLARPHFNLPHSPNQWESQVRFAWTRCPNEMGMQCSAVRSFAQQYCTDPLHCKCNIRFSRRV